MSYIIMDDQWGSKYKPEPNVDMVFGKILRRLDSLVTGNQIAVDLPGAPSLTGRLLKRHFQWPHLWQAGALIMSNEVCPGLATFESIQRIPHNCELTILTSGLLIQSSRPNSSGNVEITDCAELSTVADVSTWSDAPEDHGDLRVKWIEDVIVPRMKKLREVRQIHAMRLCNVPDCIREQIPGWIKFLAAANRKYRLGESIKIKC